MCFSRSPLAAALLTGGAALALSACGSDKTPATPSPGDKAAPAVTADAGEAKAAAVAPAKEGAPDLAAYVGKYPFDKIDGVAFDDHPLVKAGIAATVTDARVRAAIATTAGPASPIGKSQGNRRVVP